MAISLKIKGNKRSNEGIGNDLVTVGDNRFPVTDAQYPGTNGVNDFIVIRHMPDKSIYTVVTKNVTPCDSNREGTLYISVAIPAKEHVEGLFSMLIELQNAYKSSCMTYDGAMYHFLARNDSPLPFEEIINRHKVDRYSYRPVVMNDDLSAKAYLFMTPEQIADLLDDPMRGEFSRFGEVVLVPVANPSQYVSTINIPAKIWRSYKIYVNGRQTTQVLSDPDKVVTITLPETSTHKAASATFSIKQARDTRMPGIAVDDEAQIIYLNLQPDLKPVSPTPSTNGIKSKASGNANKKTIMAIFITAIVMLAIGALVYFFLLAPAGDDNNASAPDNNTVVTGTEQDKVENQQDIVDNDENNNSTGTVKETETDEQRQAREAAELKAQEAEKKAKEEEAAKKKKDIKAQFERDLKIINEAQKHSFAELEKIYRMSINYTDLEGYKGPTGFYARISLIHDIITFIKSLKNTDLTETEYKTIIDKYALRAKNVNLTGLSNKLGERTKLPSAITKSMSNTTSF